MRSRWASSSKFLRREVRSYTAPKFSDARVTGRSDDLGDVRGVFELPSNRVFSAAAADDEDLHG